MPNRPCRSAPIEIAWLTMSGRRAASARAKWPPRLWPITATRRPDWRCATSRRPLDAVQRPVGAVDVEEEAAHARLVADRGAASARSMQQAVVAGEEAGQQQHRATVAARDADAVGDGVGEQARRLQQPARLGQRAARPAGSTGTSASAVPARHAAWT